METKGIAIIPMCDYVKKSFANRYEEWLNSLSPESRQIMANPLPGVWYHLQPSIIEPTQQICRLFFNGDKKGAWQIGRHSADYSLHGIYAIFVKFGSPSFIIKRGTKIMTQYYNPSELVMAAEKDNEVIVHVTRFDNPNHLVEMRIGGWMERAIEVSGQKNVKVTITPSMAGGDRLTEFVVNWN